MLRGVLKGGGVGPPWISQIDGSHVFDFFWPQHCKIRSISIVPGRLLTSFKSSCTVQLYSYFVSQTGAGCTPSTPNELSPSIMNKNYKCANGNHEPPPQKKISTSTSWKFLCWETRLILHDSLIRNFPELKTLECDILNPDLLTFLEIKFIWRTSHI